MRLSCGFCILDIAWRSCAADSPEPHPCGRACVRNCAYVYQREQVISTVELLFSSWRRYHHHRLSRHVYWLSCLC
ncbi:hypothetical protein F5Y09DRAFT_303952 [Xylaria sp. FL1042]|nr:hypothetical protein F5Y09DRAFT_303952 [Xylaria sp. FL1042]